MCRWQCPRFRTWTMVFSQLDSSSLIIYIYLHHILYIIDINFIYITCFINISHNNFINIININFSNITPSPPNNPTWLVQLSIRRD